MNWFYAENGQQKGPVPEFEFASLIKSGTIKASSPVWREGMPDWQPLSQVRPDLLATTNAPSIGGFAVPEQQKDLLVQQMREGVLVDIPQPGVLQYMGFWWRFLARFIDNIVTSMVSCMFAMPLGALIGIAGASGGHANDNMIQVGAQLTGNVIGLIVQAIYGTWMVGKFGSTLGKMAIGAKVVMEDGSKVSYGRAFGRWAAENFLNGTIMLIVVAIPVVIVAIVGFGGFGALESITKGKGEAVAGMIAALFGAGLVGALVGAFPWWMCGFDKEKRTLHDRICATRVVRK